MFNKKNNKPKAEKKTEPPKILREFAYLDETSLYSLATSQVGALTSELSSAEIETKGERLTSSLKANLFPLPLQAGLEGEREQSKTNSFSVTRKANIQSIFKEFYDYNQENLLLRAHGNSSVLETPLSQHNLIDILEEDNTNNLHIINDLIIPEKRLQRGTLIESEIKLESVGIFQLSDLTNIFTDLGTGQEDDSALKNASLIRNFFGNSIPLKGESLHYCQVLYQGEKWIIHKTLLDDILTLIPELEIVPLYITAMVESDLFWKDYRDIIFSGATYSVMGRLKRNNIQQEWALLEKFALLRNFGGDEFHEIEKWLSLSTQELLSIVDILPDVNDSFARCLKDYCFLLADRYQKELKINDFQANYPFPIIDEKFFMQDHTYYIGIFAKITLDLLEYWGKTLNDDEQTQAPGLNAACRKIALTRNAINRLENTIGNQTEIYNFSALQQKNKSSYLDIELLALYW